jgi:putative toxin-antitoxin system antitoxin component (TIGR02293 family)
MCLSYNCQMAKLRGGRSTAKTLTRGSALQATPRDRGGPTNKERVSRSSAATKQIALFDEVRSGLPYSAVERLQRWASLSQGQLAAVLGMTGRTFARRKIEGKLSPIESDRVDRAERIVQLAADVLESDDKAREWLQRPNRGLGGQTPLSVLDTDRGVRAVEGVLMRLEHGMYG